MLESAADLTCSEHMADAHEGSSLAARVFILQICHPSSCALMTIAASPGVAGVCCCWYATAVENVTLTNPIPARDAASPVEDPTGLGTGGTHGLEQGSD